MSTTINGRRKKQLKACEAKHDRLEGAVSKNREGRKEVIKSLTEKIAAAKSKKAYVPKVAEEKKPAVEKKGKKGKK